MTAPIAFDEINTRSGFKIGRATLTRDKSLNSLLLETVDLLADRFARWRDDDDIACILLHSNSDRAFCAGADIQDLYHAIKKASGGDSPRARGVFPP